MMQRISKTGCHSESEKESSYLKIIIFMHVVSMLLI
jgi:hypothetical protein